MLREEQIDIRRARAKAEGLVVERTGKKKLFGAYKVANPNTGGKYTVRFRGFEVGDNECSCPDYKANTLGTCKHIEAVLATVGSQAPTNVRHRKAAVTRPEIHLHYGEQLDLELILPPRRSDQLMALAKEFFDAKGRWTAAERYEDLLAAVEKVPEQVVFATEALEFIDTAVDRRKLLALEKELLAELDSLLSPPAQGGAGEGFTAIGQSQQIPPQPLPSREGKRPNRTESRLQDLVSVPLYDYQLRGAIFAACRGRAILGDDMGLGKTVQALAATELLARERGIARVLVVAPASVKYQWETEIKKFTHRPVQVIEGDRPDRLNQYVGPAFYRLVNYEQVTRDLDEINAWKPDYVILDEAQRIKNWESKTSRAVKKLQSRYALVLTGTPLENKLEELYSIVQFVDDRRLGPAFQFLHDHRKLDAEGRLVGYRNLETIRERLAPIFLRRTRAEVLGQLPERTDSTVYVELAPEQRAPYEEQRSALARLLAKPVLSDLDRKRILACLTNMRMICNSTFLYDKQTNVAPKLDEFAEIMSEFIAAGPEHKAVVFTQWELMQQKAAEVLDHLKIGYSVLSGRLPADKRPAVIEKFLHDPDCRVFLSTDAGGSGLNLQAADTVIHLEVPWNPAVLEQRIARVHRLGQSNPVRVIRLVTRDSIEDRVLAVMQQKRELFNGLFEGDSDDVLFRVGEPSPFLDTLRQMVGVPGVEALRHPSQASTPVLPDRLLQAGVEMLEALAETLANRTANPEQIERAQAALSALQRVYIGHER